MLNCVHLLSTSLHFIYNGWNSWSEIYLLNPSLTSLQFFVQVKNNSSYRFHSLGESSLLPGVQTDLPSPHSHDTRPHAVPQPHTPRRDRNRCTLRLLKPPPDPSQPLQAPDAPANPQFILNGTDSFLPNPEQFEGLQASEEPAKGSDTHICPSPAENSGGEKAAS